MVADGDVGDNPDEQETLLGVLHRDRLPLLVAPGNREVRSELDAAEGELRKKGAKVWDLSHARGRRCRRRASSSACPERWTAACLHADGACVYVQRDLDALAVFLDRLPAKEPPAVLVMAVPPRGADRLALDVSDGQNVGDRASSRCSPRGERRSGSSARSGSRAVAPSTAAELPSPPALLPTSSTESRAPTAPPGRWPTGRESAARPRCSPCRAAAPRSSSLRLPGAEKT